MKFVFYHSCHTPTYEQKIFKVKSLRMNEECFQKKKNICRLKYPKCTQQWHVSVNLEGVQAKFTNIPKAYNFTWVNTTKIKSIKDNCKK